MRKFLEKEVPLSFARLGERSVAIKGLLCLAGDPIRRCFWLLLLATATASCALSQETHQAPELTCNEGLATQIASEIISLKEKRRMLQESMQAEKSPSKVSAYMKAIKDVEERMIEKIGDYDLICETIPYLDREKQLVKDAEYYHSLTRQEGASYTPTEIPIEHDEYLFPGSAADRTARAHMAYVFADLIRSASYTCNSFSWIFSYPEYNFYHVACNQQKLFYAILDYGEHISDWSRFEVRIIPDSMMLDISRAYPDGPDNSDVVQHAERMYKSILSLPSGHRSKSLVPSPP